MSALRPGATLVAAVACIGVLSACSQDKQTLDKATTLPLHQRVQSVRIALQGDDARGARAALNEFRAAVQRLADAGRINLDDAQVLVAHAEAIDAAVPASAPAAESIAPPLLTPPQLEDATTSVPPAGTGVVPETTIRPTRPIPPAPAPKTAAPRPAPKPSDKLEPADPEPENPEPTDPEPENPEPTDPEPENPEPEDPAPGAEEPSGGDTDSGASDD